MRARSVASYCLGDPAATNTHGQVVAEHFRALILISYYISISCGLYNWVEGTT